MKKTIVINTIKSFLGEFMYVDIIETLIDNIDPIGAMSSLFYTFQCEDCPLFSMDPFDLIAGRGSF